MKFSIWPLFLVVCLSGCTHYMYSGFGSYQNSGKTEEMLVHWNTTSNLFSDKKEETLVTLVTCQDRLQFKVENSSYPLYVSPEKYALLNGTLGREVEVGVLYCGELKGVANIQNGISHQLDVFLYCQKLQEDMSPGGGVPPRADPYKFQIAIQKKFSIFSDPPEPPTLSSCSR